MQDIVKRLPEVLPVKRSEIEATLVVPNAHMGAATGIIAKFARIGREEYSEAGCTIEIVLVPGDYDALVADLAKVTKGDFQIDIHGVDKSAAAAAPAASDSAKGKRGGRGGGKKGGR
jgi:ribosome maturation protein Sdo1